VTDENTIGKIRYHSRS